jgi:hypothetical protein
MTGTLLDVSKLPFERVYTCEDGSRINLSTLLDSHYDAIQALAAAELIKANESFGFAMAEPMWDEDLETLQARDAFWDYPEHFVWFVGGWGPNRDRYIANAVRKMRALLRPVINGYDGMNTMFESTLDIRISPSFFSDTVDSQNDDGTFPWGDFPWGGAAFVRMGGLTMAGAVSCLSEIEDDMVARLILGGIGQKIVVGNKLLKD